MKTRVFAALALLLLGSAPLATASLFSWMALPSSLDFEAFAFGAWPSEAWHRDRHFGIVVDAGSSGSRLLVYSWRLNNATKDTLPTINKAFPDISKKDSFLNIAPGLSSLSSPSSSPSLEATEEYLRPLIDFAKSAIPAHKHVSTPIFLLATAGMRLIPEDHQNSIMDHACTAVRQLSDFDISGGCDKHFRIISGEEEGLYGWVAVNYLNGGFGDPEKQSPPPQHPDSPTTYGFLDMGGASTQFAFEPTERMKKAHAEELKHVMLRTVGGVDVSYHIFVSTFLGFGVNEARRRYVEGLAEDAGIVVVDSTGLILDVDSPTGVHDPCLPFNLTLKSDKYLSRVTSSPTPELIGTGSLQKCLSGLHPHLRKNLPCEKQGPCLFDGVSAPIKDFKKHRFIGVSEYYYTPTSVPGAVTHGGAYHFSEFAKNAEKVCQGPYDPNTLHTIYHRTHGVIVEPDSIEENRLQLQCFKAAWVLEVLHDGFGIPREDVLNTTTTSSRHSLLGAEKSPFESVNELNGFKISWTLGAMLLHVSSLIEPHFDSL
ncbi:Golgi apyrase [Podochytrium sp. JEL0797]|nr:Golgi apyrase [Podochytrium sp. JEL0797]